MKVTVVSGSHRPSSMSRKVSDWIADRLTALWQDDVCVVDLSVESIPLWDEDVWKNTAPWQEAFGHIADRLKESDALVAVSPEWAGMASPGIKNFFLLCNSEMVGHKPCLLTGVSASRGGAYPVAELRMSSYKNNHVCHIPEHVLVRNVASVLNGGEPADEGDAYIRDRIDYALGVLRTYAEALGSVRSSGVIDHERFPNGM